MQRVSLFFLMLFISGHTVPSCAIGAIYLISKNSLLNRNGIIVIEFYGSSQQVARELNKNYPIYLKSKSGTVPLLPIEVLTGEFRVTQVMLKPSVDLNYSESYDLRIENASPFGIDFPGNKREPQKVELGTFTINNVIDKELPVFESFPIQAKKTVEMYGCGPAKWVYFKISGQDKSETFVRTKVKNSKTGTVTEYILPIEDGFVKIGHGMCSGGFLFDDGDDYAVSFALVDQSGNKSDFIQEIAFQRPAL